MGITMEGEQTDFIWGVVDFTPTTTFPDIRNRCAIHSTSGSCMVIPREGDRVRLYIQLADKDGEVVDPGTGRCDKTRMGPEKLLEVSDCLSKAGGVGGLTQAEGTGGEEVNEPVCDRDPGQIRLVDYLHQ
jgi:hypothetical protein